MNQQNPFEEFTTRLKLLIGRYPTLMTTTLSNIFTMRLIGNKTHGDLAEIAICEFINQYMYDFRSVHVGKDLYRAKSREEDITVINEVSKQEFFVSLKAYGDGPLQLSTDKDFRMFPRLEQEDNSEMGTRTTQRVLRSPEFRDVGGLNVLPLIYDEKRRRCNIMVFNYERAIGDAARISRVESGRGRKHPVYRFYNKEDEYICEVRYGSGTANALQRGLWTHTQRGAKYFDSITGGWTGYAHNETLLSLFSHALVSSEEGHASALESVREDIDRIRRQGGVDT